MARALRDQSGRALKTGTKGATVGCSDCCGSAPLAAYFQACPCQAFLQDNECAIPSEPCIYIDTRTLLSDGSALLDVVYTETVIVNVGGICYTVTTFLYSNDPNTLYPYMLPPDAVLVGGDGVTINRNQDCVEGCAELNVGPEFFEVFRCDGCNDGRDFACARQVAGLSIVVLDTTVPSYAGPGVGAWCVDRTVGYTQSQAEALGSIHDAAALLIWKRGPGIPVAVPADSCCYSSIFGNCTGLNCMRGLNWTGFGGSDKWFPLDTCCGTQQGLRYGVELAYTRTIIGAGDDPVTTTITATVVSITPRDGGGSNVNLNINTRGTRPSVGETYNANSEATVSLEPWCCLPYSGVVPMLDRIVPASSLGLPDIPVPNAPGFIYSNRVQNEAGADAATQRRSGWNVTPWASPLRLSERDDAAGTYAASGGAFGGCGVWNFQHNETMTYTQGGSDSTHVNLTVTVIPDQAFPCSYAGPCGANGWGGNLGELLP